ncbi:MAG TPA: fibronectin type III domain-containing protein [Gaiellaceae bacterium]|nr:fibronectin type III domain-containing protein [Gaiellaceae bacterium]
MSCQVSDPEGTVTSTVNVRKDGSPPGVRVAVQRGPDNDGWYNHPVGFEFSGDEGLSGIASCSPGVTYSGPDSGSATVSGSCTDGAGNVGSGSVKFPYDATGPAVEGKADRGPDANGWYNRAVTVNFSGTDAVAGVHICTAPVTYSGPDAQKTSLTGKCQDKAANWSEPKAVELSYDATPPALKRVKAEISPRGISLQWIASKDALSFTIVRRPGVKKKVSTVYSGKARKFLDGQLRAGVKYRYTVTAFDQAGNGAARGLRAQALRTVSRPVPSVRATSALRGPAPGARVGAPPVLRWSPVAKATYYNVQLFRDGKKILTLWPTEPVLRVPSSWRFAGAAFRLTPGVYRWYVWAGFGPRSASRYGKLLGTRSFVVVRG